MNFKISSDLVLKKAIGNLKLNTFSQIFGSLFLFVFLLNFILIFNAGGFSSVKKRPLKELNLAVAMLPFSLSFAYIFTSYFLSDSPFNGWEYVGVVLIVTVLLKAFRFSSDPLKVLTDVIEDLILDKSNCIASDIADNAVEDILLKKKVVKLADKKSAYNEVTKIFISFAEVFKEMSNSPKLPLIFFLNYYSVCLITTLGLCSAILKTLNLLPSEVSSANYIWFAVNLMFSGLLPSAAKDCPMWLVSTHSILNFFYLIIAFLAFTALANKSTQIFQERLCLWLDSKVLDMKWKNLEVQTGKTRDELEKI